MPAPKGRGDVGSREVAGGRPEAGRSNPGQVEA